MVSAINQVVAISITDWPIGRPRPANGTFYDHSLIIRPRSLFGMANDRLQKKSVTVEAEPTLHNASVAHISVWHTSNLAARCRPAHQCHRTPVVINGINPLTVGFESINCHYKACGWQLICLSTRWHGTCCDSGLLTSNSDSFCFLANLVKQITAERV